MMSGQTAGVAKNSPLEANYSWHEFKDLNRDLKPMDDWHTRPVPPELQSDLDEAGQVLSDKVKEIMKWSLIHGSREPEPHEAASTKDLTSIQKLESEGTHGNTAAETADENSTNESTTAPSFHSHHSESRPISLTASPSRFLRRQLNGDKPRVKRQQYSLSAGVFTSTLDLITTFKLQAEPDSGRNQVSRKHVVEAAPKVECISCFDEFRAQDITVLPCSHPYCKGCLKELVMTAMQNESSYPPKCCLSPIPNQIALLILDRKQREAYQVKAAEYAIPAQERWYCPNVKCLKWMPPKKFHRVVGNYRCPHCSTRFCHICRGRAHKSSEDCPQDFGLDATLALAEDEGWSRCYKCRAVVERSEGCRHMTCKCGAQFCYFCGVKWRTCECIDDEYGGRPGPLRRLRDMRNVEAAEEAAEIAQAIAEIEAMEREEEVERIREAERLAAELQREEEELRRIELLQRQEDERRQLQKEKEDEELRRILRTSLTEQLSTWQTQVKQLMSMQQSALNHRHVQQDDSYHKVLDNAIAKQQTDNETTMAKMKSNVNKRLANMEEQQRQELSNLKRQHEHSEDDMFLQIQIHLRDKPNKEAREQRLVEEFHKQKEQELAKMQRRFESEVNALKQNALMEHAVLTKSAENKLAEIRGKYELELETLLHEAAADRAWFEYLLQRRNNMLIENHRLMMADVDAGREPSGLSESLARTIGPFPVEDALPTTPGSESSNSLTNSFIELAADSERLHKRLEQVQELNAVPTQLSPSEAWRTMMHGTRTPVQMSPTAPVSAPVYHTSQARRPVRVPVPQRHYQPPVLNAVYQSYSGDLTMSGALEPSENQPSPALTRRSIVQSHHSPSSPTNQMPYRPSSHLGLPTADVSTNPLIPGSYPVSPTRSATETTEEQPHAHDQERRFSHSEKFVVLPSRHHSRHTSSDTTLGSTTSRGVSDSSVSVRTLDSVSSVSASGTALAEDGGLLKPERAHERKFFSFGAWTLKTDSG